DKVEDYRSRADAIPHRLEGDAALLELLPARLGRVLDLGCGDGRLLALVRDARPDASGVALDFSPPMLARARERFDGVPEVEVVEHDFSRPLPGLGPFDVVVSSFAIHHLEEVRQRELYGEVLAVLEPGGLFCNLEHVASPTPALHQEFLDLLGVPEDPSNRLVAVETQLAWLRELGFAEVECIWKWRELALLCGLRAR
ncbi:MAG TPA: class I SAM-dependent methyltransferase, partial [Thermoleophilaceae bacterium]